MEKSIIINYSNKNVLTSYQKKVLENSKLSLLFFIRFKVLG